MMQTHKEIQLPGLWPILLLFLAAWAPVQAQQAASVSDHQAREAAELVVRNAGSGNQGLRTRRRQDLERLLLTIEERKWVRSVYFYEMESPPRTAFDAYSVWMVAVVPSTPALYELYVFEASEGFNGPLREFNRLISQLSLSIANEKATSLARFFLGCCVGGEFSEIVLNEEGLQHAVQRYYLRIYGDIWRALEAYSQWWQEFQTNAPDVAPTIRFENGRYRVVLKRILVIVGRHPQLQEWDLEISRDGSVRVLAMQPIFPKQTRWLFYDLRSTMIPPIP